MDRLVTSLVFCEAPLDFAYVGAPADTVAKLAADAQACGDLPSTPAEEEAAATETRDVSASSARGLQAECAPALDGLNCFETVVMPSH
jgi:hypothetical protein